MKTLKLSAIVVVIIVAAVAVGIYMYLAPLFHSGNAWIDAVMVFVGIVALMISRTPQIEVDNTSTQYYAQTQVIGSAGVTLLTLAVLHTIAAIMLPYNITLPWLILVGIAVAWHAFRIATVSAGAAIQTANDRKSAVHYETKKNLADLIKEPAKRLREALLGLETTDATAQQDAINAIKNVELAVKGFAGTNQAGVSSLTNILTSWATSLEIATKRIDSLSRESEKTAFLKEITASARQVLANIKSV